MNDQKTQLKSINIRDLKTQQSSSLLKMHQLMVIREMKNSNILEKMAEEDHDP